jgi:Cys/Met metabolism PLP-dependent enzyme
MLANQQAVADDGVGMEHAPEHYASEGFDCWLLRRSIATLALRVRTQCAGALQLAEFLTRHPAIEQPIETHEDDTLQSRARFRSGERDGPRRVSRCMLMRAQPVPSGPIAARDWRGNFLGNSKSPTTLRL